MKVKGLTGGNQRKINGYLFSSKKSLKGSPAPTNLIQRVIAEYRKIVAKRYDDDLIRYELTNWWRYSLRHHQLHPPPKTMFSSSPLSEPPPPSDYDVILDAYGKLISHTPPGLSIKVLRTMLDFAPSESGRINIAHEILSSQDVSCLGDYYINTMILPLRASGGKTAPQSHPSGIDSVNDIATTLDPSSRNFQRTLKQQLLLRDDNRCIITGTFDRGKYGLLPDTERNSLALNRVLTDDTQACHIVPFVIADFDDSNVSNSLSRFLP